MVSQAIPAPERLDELMHLALSEARRAVEHDDVPIGAVVVRSADLEVVAGRHNERELTGDPTAHAEILAIRDAADAVGSWRLDGHIVVVTLEPCPMCAGAIWSARIDGIVFGAADPKAGATGSLYSIPADPRLNHESWVRGGVQEHSCAALLKEFFRVRRNG